MKDKNKSNVLKDIILNKYNHYILNELFSLLTTTFKKLSNWKYLQIQEKFNSYSTIIFLYTIQRVNKLIHYIIIFIKLLK